MAVFDSCKLEGHNENHSLYLLLIFNSRKGAETTSWYSIERFTFLLFVIFEGQYNFSGNSDPYQKGGFSKEVQTNMYSKLNQQSER